MLNVQRFALRVTKHTDSEPKFTRSTELIANSKQLAICGTVRDKKYRLHNEILGSRTGTAKTSPLL